MVAATALAEQVGIVFQILLAPSTLIFGPSLVLSLESPVLCTRTASAECAGPLLDAPGASKELEDWPTVLTTLAYDLLGCLVAELLVDNDFNSLDKESRACRSDETSFVRATHLSRVSAMPLSSFFSNSISCLSYKSEHRWVDD